MQPNHEVDDLQALLHEEYGAPRLDDQFSADLIARLQAEAAPSSTPTRPRRSPLAIFLGATTAAALVIAVIWVSLPRIPEKNRELAQRITTESARSERLLHSDEFQEATDYKTDDLMSVLSKSEIAPEARVLNESLVQNESKLAAIPDVTSETIESEKESLFATHFSLSKVETRNLSVLSRKSLKQNVAEAKVILVATALKSAPATPKRPGDAAENLITFRVTRVLKGKFTDKVVTTRTPTAPQEFLKKEWVVMLSAEYMAGNHRFAGLYNIKLEPKIQAVLTGKQ